MYKIGGRWTFMFLAIILELQPCMHACIVFMSSKINIQLPYTQLKRQYITIFAWITAQTKQMFLALKFLSKISCFHCIDNSWKLQWNHPQGFVSCCCSSLYMFMCHSPWVSSWVCACAHEHCDCDSRFIAAFRHVIVLLRNLLWSSDCLGIWRPSAQLAQA